MKRLAAILLLALLLFNWCGYRLLTAIQSQIASSRLETRIDQEYYSIQDLVELRIPLEVPYQLNQADFERSYGEVEVDGRVYVHVKRKIENGHLILLCLPNENKEQIEKAGKDYFKGTNGLDQRAPEKSGKTHKQFSTGDYDDRLAQWDIATQLYSRQINQGHLSTNLPLTTIPVLVQPPESVTL